MKKIYLLVGILAFLACEKDEPLGENRIMNSNAPSNSLQLKSTSTNDYLLNLISITKNMIDNGLISAGLGNSLIVKINNAIKSNGKGNLNAFRGQINALIKEIEALINNNIITQEEGQVLINMAENGLILSKGSFIDPRDGNEYSVTLVGEQIWMAENLGYLPEISPSTDGSFNEPLYYVFGYEGTDVTEAKATANYNTYGVLYNWTAAMAGESSSSINPSGVQGVCPSGWHLPSDAEWTQLTEYLGGETIAGGKLKETGYLHWESPNTDATNETGFTALPGGWYYAYTGTFSGLGTYGSWWSSTTNPEPSHPTYAFIRAMYYNSGAADLGLVDNGHKDSGCSIRCVKD